MMRHGLLAGSALLSCCALTLLERDAHATDAQFLATPRDKVAVSEAAPYDSEYAAAARAMGSGGNTPESDARPGEYYFLLGARAVRKKDYAFAIQMYEVAASWAFKPAEYNLGVIYSRGQGVPADLPRGMAWMALAAERNEQRYIDAREAVYAALTKEQFDAANVIWRDLKKTYGDEVALRRAKARWAEVRANMTGSRVGAPGHLDVSAPSERVPDVGVRLYENAQTGAMIRSMARSSADAAGGQVVDGTASYRQLRESDNPYDPKFQHSLGTATVGPPVPAKAGASNKPETDAPDSTKGDH